MNFLPFSLRFSNAPIPRPNFSRGSPFEFRDNRLISTHKRKSLYQILDVPPTASKEEIKEAYYTLSKKYHPDVIGANVSSAHNYLEVKEAYEILCDEEKRNEHDRRLAVVEFRRNRSLAIERHKIYPFVHSNETRSESQRGAFRQSLSNITPSVESLSNAFLSASAHWRCPFYNPTEEAQKQEKEAKFLRWFIVLFITFLFAYYVSLRFFAHKRKNSGINLH